MPADEELPDRVRRTHEVTGDQVLHRFGNGLQVRSEVFHKADPQRILPLGGPQSCLMNHLLHFPESVRGKRVLEPFAGSGGIGLMALQIGAAHVDFVDINPRAIAFVRENAALNDFAATRFRTLQADIAQYTPDQRVDLILANPPFVPTPAGIEGTLTSDGGEDGSHFVEILLGRLDALLEPSGRALVYVFQFVHDGRPLIADFIESRVARRQADLTITQEKPLPFDVYLEAYAKLFPKASAAIEAWRRRMQSRLPGELGLCHYVIDVGPVGDAPTRCRIRDDFARKFGGGFRVPCDDAEKLAFARAFENLVPRQTNSEEGGRQAE